MPRIVYVNGRYVPYADAGVHVEDRGYQFSDGVYEVVPVLGRLLLDEDGHLRRLARSLRELQIAPPMHDTALRQTLRETIRRNRIEDGVVYIQVTRGVARRDHPFPNPPQRPATIIMARPIDAARFDRRRATGVKIITTPDLRWGRCDIKSISLLPNILAKQAAREAGAYEAWLVDAQGKVTEGSSTTAWIIDKTGALITRPLDEHILPGVTRETLISAMKRAGLSLIERAFSVAEAKEAAEAFLTAATAGVLPIVAIDGAPIGCGLPGPRSRRFYELYREAARGSARA